MTHKNTIAADVFVSTKKKNTEIPLVSLSEQIPETKKKNDMLLLKRANGI